MNEKFYKNTVAVERITNTLDSNRKTVKVKTTVHSTKGLLEFLSAKEQILSDKNEILADFRLYMPNDYKNLANDVLMIDSVEYTIYSIDDTLLNANHQELLVTKFRG
jgi:two-component SAPR family response regulator